MIVRNQEQAQVINENRKEMTMASAPSTTIGRLWLAGAVALLALLAAMAASAPAGAAVEDYGIESLGASLSTTQAGAHPDFTTEFTLKTSENSFGELEPFARTRDISIEMPPGLIGNPETMPKCAVEDLVNYRCPIASQIGVTTVALTQFPPFEEPVYNMKPSSPDSPGEIGFVAIFYPITAEIGVRSDTDYGLDAKMVGISSQAPLISASTTLWGVPADPSHDSHRYQSSLDPLFCGGICGGSNPSGTPKTAYMTNPTTCGNPLSVSFGFASYALPDRPSTGTAAMGSITGCDAVPFAPGAELSPTTTRAASASGLDATISLAQAGLTDPSGLGSSDLRKAVVTLPEGVTINPASADGLGSCSEEQIGLIPGSSPPRFDKADPTCPSSSKIGTVKIKTPLLEDPLEGSLYVAMQNDNPFHSLLAGYMVVKGSGITIKLAGSFELDPSTGRIVATFDNNPQQPFSRLEMHFKGGARGVLKMPESCGTYKTDYELTPWSGTAPVHGVSEFTIDEGCGTGGFAPGLSAGATHPVAGDASPFVLNVTREDGEQNVSGIGVTLPQGLLAKLKGVPLCPDSGASSGNCPVSTQVGSAKVAVGAGSLPLWVPQAGKPPAAIYLSGPYKGAPYSLVVTVPAQAGPFDLGTVVTRAGIYVDPVTAQVTVNADPLPQILQGIPVDYRRVHVAIDRSGFTVNPTSCEPMSIAARIASDAGAVVTPQNRFQVGDCASLGFRPNLKLRLYGKTHRSAHPKLRAVLSARKGDANIGKAVVTLPKTEFLENAHIRTICTRVQYAANSCPKGAIYGYAKAWSPLLDQPLQGPVYLRSSNHQLPDLVASLDGQIHIDLAGRIDSVHGRIRNTFWAVPDAPVSRFVLTMQGGKKGLLVNNTELCGAKPRAAVKFTGHNGKVSRSNPLVQASCGSKHGKRHTRHRR